MTSGCVLRRPWTKEESPRSRVLVAWSVEGRAARENRHADKLRTRTGSFQMEKKMKKKRKQV